MEQQRYTSISATDLPGRAIHDFYFGQKTGKLWVYDCFGPPVEMEIATYFREKESMPALEQTTLEQCYGSILDIGSGAGSHCLAMQAMNKDVTALEVSPAACEVMKARGIEQVICKDIFEYSDKKYDTLLLLMNGIGLCGTINGLKHFLKHCRSLLKQDGIILFDASDVGYLFEEGVEKPKDHYYGEIDCYYRYKGKSTDWFRWLYIDEHTLKKVARAEGWSCSIITREDEDRYVAKLWQ